MQNEIAIPEPGVPEDKWMRVGPAYILSLQRENAKLREALERIAAYDAPDAHAMIEQAKAALK